SQHRTPLRNQSSLPHPMKRIEQQAHGGELEVRHLFVRACLATMLVSGCAIGPNYKRPAVNTPADFRFSTNQSTNSFGDVPWWEAFQDPALVDLIRKAVT